ncbi:MAG: hypothetical protein ABI053_07405 [Lacisediminihabitans sp.]
MSIHHTTMRRMSAVSLIAALTLTGGLLTGCSTQSDTQPAEAHPAMQVDSTANEAQIALYSAMRTLWGEHMQWTYDTVVAFAAGSPGLDPTIGRILQNQVDIGKAIAPYYGDAAATQLTELLTTHIKDAVPVLAAAKAGDSAALDKAVADWYANAQEIGDFLATANPNWKQADMRDMMKMHITQTIGYATDILTGDYAKAITDYDSAEAHMVQMADMLSMGIIAQFPAKF